MISMMKQHGKLQLQGQPAVRSIPREGVGCYVKPNSVFFLAFPASDCWKMTNEWRSQPLNG
jgi:hypothetical protein